uniref:G_PROTEIN_RECEP_F1_2 domain-containing protein n=1 Tax=Heterorhabditis bacteriophora TaxID=37862 RepID=A0A1I7XKG6_HETBA
MSSSSINWYLAVLSASDTLILISAFFVLSLPRLGEYLTWWHANYIRLTYWVIVLSMRCNLCVGNMALEWCLNYGCQARKLVGSNRASLKLITHIYSVAPYMYGLMMMAQTISVFMTVGVSVHRYIGVCHPYKSVEWLPKKRVTTFIISLVLFSIVFNTTRNIFFGWAYTIVMYAIPFSLLIGLNSMVFSAVRRSRRMHMVSQCGAENDEFAKKAERKERQTSIMLVAIVLLFISCNTLAFVCNIMENLDQVGPVYQTMVTFNNLLRNIACFCAITYVVIGLGREKC